MFEKLAGRKPGFVDAEDFRDYAVMVPYLPEARALLFELRADTLARQPGEVSFPGGTVEPGETFEAAAVRETAEELLVPGASIHVVAPLDRLHHLGASTIHPFVAEIEGYAGSFSPDEVKAVFEVPFDFFLDTEPQVYRNEISVTSVDESFPIEQVPTWPYPWAKAKSNVLFYTYDEKVIWGMTARIARNLADLYKAAYRRP